MIILTRYKLKVQYLSSNPKECRELEKALKFFDEKAVFTTAYQNKKWDGLVKYYNWREQTFYFGLLSLVIKHLDKEGITYELVDFPAENKIPLDRIKYNPELRDYQVEAIKAFLTVQHGIIKIPTRGGKTFVASEILKILLTLNPKFNVLMLFDSGDLIYQTRDDVVKFLGWRKNQVALLQGENVDLGHVTFAMIQTVQSIYDRKIIKYNKKKVDGKWIKTPKTSEQMRGERSWKQSRIAAMNEYLDNVDFLIVDECHEFSSDARVEVLKKIRNLTYSLYLSATPFRKNDLFGNLNLRQVSSDICYIIPEQVLRDKGFLAKTKVLLFTVDHEKNRNIEAEYPTYLEYQKNVIVNNEKRNSILIHVVEILRKFSLKTLVLFNFKEHGYSVSKITGDPFLSGDDSLENRKYYRKQFLKGLGKILLANNIFKKGITLPEVQVMFNAAAGKEETLVTQKKGRVLGVTAKKDKALIIDFVDIFGTYFSQHSLSRINQYIEEVGENHVDVLNVDDRNFYTDLKEYLVGWFDLKTN